MQSRTRVRSRGLIVVVVISALMLMAAAGFSWVFASMTAETAECGRANPLVEEASSYLGQPAPAEANWRQTESDLQRLADQLRSVNVLDHGERLADAVDNLASVASHGDADGWSTSKEQLRQRVVGMLDACGLSAG